MCTNTLVHFITMYFKHPMHTPVFSRFTQLLAYYYMRQSICT